MADGFEGNRGNRRSNSDDIDWGSQKKGRKYNKEKSRSQEVGGGKGKCKKWQKNMYDDFRVEGVQCQTGDLGDDIHEEEVDELEDCLLAMWDSKPKKKQASKTPNFFIAIQISNDKIKSELAGVQTTIVEKDPRLEEAMTSISKLHLTLLVLSLNSENDVERSIVALDRAAELLRPIYQSSPLTLDIAGLGTFGNAVIFAEVNSETQKAQLQKIVDTVVESLSLENIVSPDRRRFKAHITVAKMSKMTGKGIRLIKPDLYKASTRANFGTEHATTIQLCEMNTKDDSGYYHVEHMVQFGPNSAHVPVL